MVLEIYMEIIICIPRIVEFGVHFGPGSRGRCPSRKVISSVVHSQMAGRRVCQ